MKRMIALLLILSFALSLTGCGCKHTWVEATCTAPKTCSQCGETEGDVLPHTWEEAACTAAKTCSGCGLTEGEALPHTWVDAACEAPKTCSVCGGTEGEALGHTWVDATYEAPKTCTACGATEGEALVQTGLGYEVEFLLEGIEFMLMWYGNFNCREEGHTEDGLPIYRVGQGSSRFYITFVLVPEENSNQVDSVQMMCEGGDYDFELMVGLIYVIATYYSDDVDENLLELSGYGAPVGTTEEGHLIYTAVSADMLFTVIQEDEDHGTATLSRVH